MIELDPHSEYNLVTGGYLAATADGVAFFDAIRAALAATIPPYTFRLDGWEGPGAYPIEDQRPGHRVEIGPIGP